jgi:hypothetical protein
MIDAFFHVSKPKIIQGQLRYENIYACRKKKKHRIFFHIHSMTLYTGSMTTSETYIFWLYSFAALENEL